MGMFDKLVGAYEMKKRIDQQMNENAMVYKEQIEAHLKADAEYSWVYKDRIGEFLREEEEKDIRYNVPKGKHTASEKQIDEAIESTEIYQRAKEHILNAQRGQIGYGIDKYPETLNANTWSMIESIDHIIDESVDKLHYLVMLRIQLEREANKAPEECIDDEFRGDVLLADGVEYRIHPEPTEDVVAKKDTMCKVRMKGEYVDAVFIDIFQYSDIAPPSPMIGGHSGGITSYPVAVVRIGNELREFKLSYVKFEEDVK